MKLQLFTREQRSAWVVRRITYLLEGKYHRRAGALAADLGVSRQSLYAWKRGITIPGEENRGRIRDLFEEVKQDDEKKVL